ncbi:Derlin-2 [Hypsizygus marmoreus]|uniref:Derlin n=1 Tax=Hypsizygus marmoreus TaxID=39966 RepID=A0A369J719_HYPMA|nr:Derlin-2 [Hypsizygus marmoreus]
MDSFVAELRKIPPVTRFLCASSLGITIPVLMNMVSPYKTLYVRDLVFKKLEIWRLFTSFFLGSGGINYIFELVMLYRTTDQLESGPYAQRSADLAYQLLFASASIIALTTPLSAFIFTRPLLLCLTYLSSALAPLGAQTSLMGLITFPVAYLPYMMIGMDLLMAGPGAAAQAVAGAVVGHFWWWGIWGGGPGAQGVLAPYGRAPTWMRTLVGEGALPPPPPGAAVGGAGVAGGVHVIPPRRTVDVARSSGRGSGSSGYNWGNGQTLGSS